MGNAYKDLKKSYELANEEDAKKFEKGASGNANSTAENIKNIGADLKDSFRRWQSGEGDFKKKKP